MNLENIIPKDGPSIEEVKKYIKKYSNELIVIKCGGSVLLDVSLFNQFIEDISAINQLGLSVICLLYTSPSPRDRQKSRMPSSA